MLNIPLAFPLAPPTPVNEAKLVGSFATSAANLRAAGPRSRCGVSFSQLRGESKDIASGEEKNTSDVSRAVCILGPKPPPWPEQHS